MVAGTSSTKSYRSKAVQVQVLYETIRQAQSMQGAHVTTYESRMISLRNHMFKIWAHYCFSHSQLYRHSKFYSRKSTVQIDFMIYFVSK